MKAILGGKDAQGIENFRAIYPDFKVANNDFKIVYGLVLEFRGRRNSPLFIFGLEIHSDNLATVVFHLLGKLIKKSVFASVDI